MMVVMMMILCFGKKRQEHLLSITPCCFFRLITTWILETLHYLTWLFYHGIAIHPGRILLQYSNHGMLTLMEQETNGHGTSVLPIDCSITSSIHSSNQNLPVLY